MQPTPVASLVCPMDLGCSYLGGAWLILVVRPLHASRMTTRRALAEITVDPQRGWVLPRFGGQPFRYQAWAHFEKDPTWGSATWTLLVELAGAPPPSADKVEATVSFVAPGA